MEAVKTSKAEEIRESLYELENEIFNLTDSRVTVMGKEYSLREWLTLVNYAKKYNLSPSRLQNWIDRNKLPQGCLIIIPELNNLKLIQDREYFTGKP